MAARSGAVLDWVLGVVVDAFAALLFLALFGFLVWAGVQAWIYGGPVAGVLALALPVLAIAISLREWTRMLREWLYL